MIARELFKEWVQALRSGDYKQGFASLHRIEKGHHFYCCLGVLCELQYNKGDLLKRKHTDIVAYHASHNGMTSTENSILPIPLRFEDGTLSYSTSESMRFEYDYLSDKTKNKFEYIEKDVYNLAALNDKGVPFDVIADIIEEVWLRGEEQEELQDRAQ